MKLQGLGYILSDITNIHSKMFTANDVVVVVHLFKGVTRDSSSLAFDSGQNTSIRLASKNSRTALA
jgi:hypothetical protein